LQPAFPTATRPQRPYIPPFGSAPTAPTKVSTIPSKSGHLAPKPGHLPAKSDVRAQKTDALSVKPAAAVFSDIASMDDID
jgi:hypothetical protein